MKRVLFAALLAVASISFAVAQPRAIGGRIGYGVEFSYQHALGESNMVQLEAGVPGFSGLEAMCTYDWIDPGNVTVPWDNKGEWHWYAGVGGGLGANFGFDAAYIGAVGRIGIEYDFWFPLQLSVDFRPMLGVAFNSSSAAFAWDAYAGAIGIGVRYLFH